MKLQQYYKFNRFTRRDGRVIINSRCRCGARQTEHAPTALGAAGHGECLATNCAKFTWSHFILLKEKGATS